MKYLLIFTLFSVVQATIITPFSTPFQIPELCDQLETGGTGGWSNAKEAVIQDNIIAHSQVTGMTLTLYCTGYDIAPPLEGASNMMITINARILHSEFNLWIWKLYPALKDESTIINPDPWINPATSLKTVIFANSFNISSSRTNFGIALNVQSGPTVWVDSIQMKFDYEMITSIQSIMINTDTITVQGNGFWNNPNILCKYNADQIFQGIYVSLTEIYCPLPILLPGQYIVEIAPNGNQYTSNGIIFEVESSTSGSSTSGSSTSGSSTSGSSSSGSSTSESNELPTCSIGCISGIVISITGLGFIIAFFKFRPPLGGWITKHVPGRVSGPSERSTLPPEGLPRDFNKIKNKTHTRPASNAKSLKRMPSEYLSRNPFNDLV